MLLPKPKVASMERSQFIEKSFLQEEIGRQSKANIEEPVINSIISRVPNNQTNIRPDDSWDQMEEGELYIPATLAKEGIPANHP